MYDNVTRMLGIVENFPDLIKGINEKNPTSNIINSSEIFTTCPKDREQGKSSFPHLCSILSWGRSHGNKSNQICKS